nr:MAG TPA: hypothetical protein [Caudoviricetes sp.]
MFFFSKRKTSGKTSVVSFLSPPLYFVRLYDST